MGTQPWGVAVNPGRYPGLGDQLRQQQRVGNRHRHQHGDRNNHGGQWAEFGRVFTPNGARAYVVNCFNNNVSVIDTATNTVTGTINVGQSPAQIIVNPAGTRAYVTNVGGTVSVINTANNTVNATIQIPGTGAKPAGALLNSTGTRLYIANQGNGTVTVINTSNNAVLNTISFYPGATTTSRMVITPDDSTIYVTNGTDGSIAVINATTETLTSTMTGFSTPRFISMSPDGTKLFVTQSGNNRMTQVNLGATFNSTRV